MEGSGLSASIKEKAIAVGFDLVGISPARSFSENQFFKVWLERGYAAEMGYMERNPARRHSVSNLEPEARSVISCALNYNTAHPHSIERTDGRKGRISRYAWGEDYHSVMEGKLTELLEFIKTVVNDKQLNSRLYVDTGPVLDRVYAKYAGIGWFGKNTCVINQQIGSWIFLGEIITSLELQCDVPPPDRCGTCTRCIDACPTGAIVEPYVLDSRLCISYLTIELRGRIPLELREGMGNHIFGCDICQDVCPWNGKAKLTREGSFEPGEAGDNPELSALARMSRDEFDDVFMNSPIKRAKRGGLLRNIMVAMGNSGDKEFVPVIREALYDGDPLVRAHAAWALWKLEGEGALEELSTVLGHDGDPLVREEIEDILRVHRSAQRS